MNKIVFILLAITFHQPASAMFKKKTAAKLELLNQKLLNSIQNNDLEIARHCLKQGADVHTQDQEGNTPLMRVCQKPEIGIL